MRIEFIQNVIDKVRHAKKFNTINEKLNSINLKMFELYLNINSQKSYSLQKLDSYKGIGIIDLETQSIIFKHIPLLFKNLEFKQYSKENLFDSNLFFIWGTRFSEKKLKIAQRANFLNRQLIYLETGFLYNLINYQNKIFTPYLRTPLSFVIDSVAPYYDARFPSTLENMINNKNIIVTEEQKQRARKCIDKIVETHLTKYNHQPIFEPKIGRDGVKKILVVDQSYGDASIAKGWGSDETFEKMLQAAIDENPDADIIVKTHPDTMTGNRGGYYTGLKSHDNIYTMTEPINPISLIKYADKVYVCTTQFGFEALMCGKEVRVFGMPFYANWGLTQDEQICERRINKRSLEEIFYLAYIEYSHYINPETKQRCEIEEAMDYLLKLREEYKNTLSNM